ncbi:MAG: hypothetical protein SV429_04395, partial [Pseudomonadota bacterium]|nr:hypothetical protein [Pseudomonadota bacterium]
AKHAREYVPVGLGRAIPGAPRFCKGSPARLSSASVLAFGPYDYQSGGFETMPTYEVPRNVIQAALNATKLIGNGLYGVDIKQSGNRVAVIEVNDNPSIDAGVEDRFLGGEFYTLIMQEFLSRMEENRRR